MSTAISGDRASYGDKNVSTTWVGWRCSPNLRGPDFIQARVLCADFRRSLLSQSISMW